MDLPQKVRAPNPWALFGYFLSQQKVTPRRGGETRQKAFRTRQDCEGADCRVAVKRNDIITYQNTVPRTERQPVQEAALRACLEGQAAKTASAWRSPRLGIGQSRYRPRLVTSKIQGYRMGDGSCLSQRQVFSRGLGRRMLPYAGVFRPLRRTTRRCPPWTRTGLMSGDRKATRYWALGFGYGAAPAKTSPAPVRQRPGNRPALHPFGLQAPTIPFAHR